MKIQALKGALSEDCPKQFIIHRDRPIEDNDWVSEAVGSWTLCRSRSLPRVRIVGPQSTLAVALGWFVHAGRFYAADDELRIAEGTNWDDFCDGLAGRFVLLQLSAAGEVWVRLDASGQLPVVYDEYTGHVASSPRALAHFRTLEVDQHALRIVTRSDGKTWFPFGIVPFAGVKRLLPEQALSLSSQSLLRLPARDRRRISDPARQVHALLDSIASVIAAIGARGTVRSHLTAGVDSRMVLAAALRAGTRTSLTTVRGMDAGTRLDDHVARSIASACELEHTSVPLLEPSQAEIDAWHCRAGYCIDDAVVGMCRTVRQSVDDSTILTGTCGEVGRAFYWRASDLEQVGADPEDLVRRLGFNPSHTLLDKASAWIEEAGAQHTRARLMDMAYIEQRLAGWAGPAVYGHAINKPTIGPFNSRNTFDQMLSLPESFRLAGKLPRRLIETVRPELLDFPFNQASGLSRLMFAKQEIKSRLPTGVKRQIRGALRGLEVRSGMSSGVARRA